jgi:predicted adenylyl cyclase CyaB
LFLVGRTRIHLDRVEGLGEFLEVEVVLREGESAEVGVKEAETLVLQLGIGRERLVAAAYMDLLQSDAG